MNSLSFGEVSEGDDLPAFPVPLTIQRLVMEAAANRDFAPIHHDAQITRATGAPDPYANTMLVQAIFEATLREWMGLEGRLRKLGFSMRAFATAGATLSGHGKVVAIRAGEHGGHVDVAIWTESGARQTATGTATVWLPEEASGEYRRRGEVPSMANGTVRHLDQRDGFLELMLAQWLLRDERQAGGGDEVRL